MFRQMGFMPKTVFALETIQQVRSVLVSSMLAVVWLQDSICHLELKG
jgi:hypothetical protein